MQEKQTKQQKKTKQINKSIQKGKATIELISNFYKSRHF